MNAPVTRRTLLGATAIVGTTAAVGASAAGIPVTALSELSPDPDTGLLDLICRHAKANAIYEQLETQVERCRAIALAAYPDRPQALQMREEDFRRTGLGVGLSDGEGNGPRWYGFRGVEWMRDRPTTAWFPGRADPSGEGDEARRLEIVAAFDAWLTGRQAIDVSSGWDVASDMQADAGDTLAEIEAEILATEPATFAGLVAKARWSAYPGLNDVTAGIWAKRVAADVVALANRVGVAS